MFEKTLESESNPGAQFTIRPLNGPKSLSLTSDRVPYGDAVYDAFRYCCTGWVDAPMLGGEVSKKYDHAVIDHLLPGFVQEVVFAALGHWSLTEEERKNS